MEATILIGIILIYFAYKACQTVSNGCAEIKCKMETEAILEDNRRVVQRMINENILKERQ